jgi:hypothetical protein
LTKLLDGVGKGVWRQPFQVEHSEEEMRKIRRFGKVCGSSSGDVGAAQVFLRLLALKLLSGAKEAEQLSIELVGREAS